MDNVKARILQSDGCYIRAPHADGEPEFRAQERLLALRTGPTTSASDLRSAPVGSNGAATDSIAAEGVREAFVAHSNGGSESAESDGNGAVQHREGVRNQAES
jgi:hypothetical protein